MNTNSDTNVCTVYFENIQNIVITDDKNVNLKLKLKHKNRQFEKNIQKHFLKVRKS